MFSVITNIYNKKTKGPNLVEFFTVTGKLKKLFFLQLEMFDACTAGDMVHIDTIIKLLPRTLTRDMLLLESRLQTCMTYTIAECTVNKLLMMD